MTYTDGLTQQYLDCRRVAILNWIQYRHWTVVLSRALGGARWPGAAPPDLGGWIWIIVVGGLVGLMVIGILLWFFVFRPMSKKANAGRGAPPPVPQVPLDQDCVSSRPLPLPANQTPGLSFVLASGKTVTFASLPISIGRDEKNDLLIDDETVSASHAYIYYDERAKAICIADSDSLNGLFINDQPTRKNILRDSARIRLGNVQLTFHNTGYVHPESR